jgi:hypothetical protein
MWIRCRVVLWLLKAEGLNADSRMCAHFVGGADAG